MQTCLWEVFGDDVFQGKLAIPAGKWRGCSLSQIVVPEVKECAVNLKPTRDAMSVDKASLLSADLTIPQAWSPAVQRHPAGFQAIKYSSRFLDQACLALFDRETGQFVRKMGRTACKTRSSARIRRGFAAKTAHGNPPRLN